MLNHMPQSISITELKNLPSHWRVVRLKDIATISFSNVDKLTQDAEIPVKLCNYVDVYHNDFITEELPFMEATAIASEIERFSLQRGDVLITKDSESWDDIAVPAYVAQTFENILCGYHLAMVRPHQINGRYLFRAFSSQALNTQFSLSVSGVTRFGLGRSAIADALFPLPPMSEQIAIANYLDQQTAQIDALIKAMERLLIVLAEKRQATITHAVTRGLDPDVPLRDSGVEWIGAIPAHWEVIILRRLVSSMDYGVSESVGPEGDIGILRMGDISDGRISFENIGFVNDVPNSLLLKEGDLLFNRTNSLAQVAKVGLYQESQEYPISFASYLVRIRCGDDILPEYLNFLLNSPLIVAWARSQALPAIGQVNLNPNRYSYVQLPVPPLSEQYRVVAYLNERINKFDRLAQTTQDMMALLQERRASLISAAVTGHTSLPS